MIYLTVITTALVLTQIIRLLQNWQQLKRQGDTADLVLRVYRKWERWLDDNAIIDKEDEA